MTKLALSLILAAFVGRAQYINGSRTIEGPINYCSDAGASDAYACSFSPAITAYQTGTVYSFRANTANTGAATVNFNALGAKTIRKRSDQDLADNDIKAGQLVQMVYDGTYMQMLSQVANAAAGGSGTSNVPTWAPSTSYAAGDTVRVSLNPNSLGSYTCALRRTTSGTSGSTFNAAEASEWGVAGCSTLVEPVSTSITWNKPLMARRIRVTCIGGGGGGGGGGRQDTGTNRSGGGGGGSGGRSVIDLSAPYVTDTVSITIGAGGTAGASATSDSSSGGTGGTGGASSFGSYIKANGGVGGGGGGTAATGNAAGGTGLDSPGSVGGAGATGVGPTASTAYNFGSSGGGGGAGRAGGSTSSTGGGSASTGCSFCNGQYTNGAGGSSGGAGSQGTADDATLTAGGSGGASYLSGAAGTAGTNGIAYGAGAGGGAASDNGFASGAGGVGAAGFCRVVTEF